MCWQLTVAGPPAADLPDVCRRFSGGPEADALVLALFPPDDGCWWVGPGCACSLYRTVNEADRLRQRAERRRWPAALLRRRIEAAGDWVGLDPALRAAVAKAAERGGRVGLFLRWEDGRAKPAVSQRRTVTPDELRADTAVVGPGLLVTVRQTPAGGG